jgi:PAS domain S-box-containing protein
VKNAGGSIQVTSTEGKGSCFSIVLPLCRSREKTKSADEKLSDCVPTNSARILIVDDEDMLRDIGKEMLSLLGHTVETAANGNECMEILRKDRKGFDLVILDMIMPELDGYHTLLEMTRLGIDTRVIISSGFSFEHEKDDLLTNPLIVARLNNRSISTNCPWSLKRPFPDQGILRLIFPSRRADSILTAGQTAAVLTAGHLPGAYMMPECTAYDDSFYEDLFVYSTAISAVTDENGILRKVNKRAMEMFFGTEQDLGSVIGRNILEFIHVDDRAKVIERWQESLREKKEVNYDLRMSAADGHVMYFLVSGRPIVRDGKVVLFHYQALDMMDHKVQEQNLLASASAEVIAQIAGGFAHDFNNLLTVINGYAEIMRLSIDEGSPLFHKASQICEAGRQASQLTGRMLEFSRKSKAKAELVDINMEISNQEGIIRHVIGENVSVGFAKSQGLGKVLIEPSRLATLLVNLTVNAKEAMPRGGEIVISTEPYVVDASSESLHTRVSRGSYVRLSIQDNGEGMPEEVCRQVFDPFFSTGMEGEGSACGLRRTSCMRQKGIYPWSPAPEPGRPSPSCSPCPAPIHRRTVVGRPTRRRDPNTMHPGPSSSSRMTIP